MSRTLICGDSFAANWTKQYPSKMGWVNWFDADNVAQAGVSEYKILKQIESVQMSDYDSIIVVHTSPYRVHTGKNPLHKNSVMHDSCDLIYSDLENSNSNDPVVNAGLQYFKHIFDTEYYDDLYRLVFDKIKTLTGNKKTLHVTFFDVPVTVDKNFLPLFRKHRGDMNHLDEVGNRRVMEYVNEWLNNDC